MRQTLKRILPPSAIERGKRVESSLRRAWGRQLRAQRLLAAPFPRQLDVLARVYGTDKSGASHGYTTHYQRHLKGMRRSARSILEIGIGGETSLVGYDTPYGGQSLRMWQSYFPNAHILGIDIERKEVSGPRITVRQGSQDDPVFLAGIAEEFGPFDVIVDDGSHVGRHVSASFRELFPHVRPGGVYVIEDLAMSYLEDWEGGPPGTPGTQAELIKGFVDDVLRRYWDTDGAARDIESIHLYDQLVFVVRSGGGRRSRT